MRPLLLTTRSITETNPGVFPPLLACVHLAATFVGVPLPMARPPTDATPKSFPASVLLCLRPTPLLLAFFLGSSYSPIHPPSPAAIAVIRSALPDQPPPRSVFYSPCPLRNKTRSPSGARLLCDVRIPVLVVYEPLAKTRVSCWPSYRLSGLPMFSLSPPSQSPSPAVDCRNPIPLVRAILFVPRRPTIDCTTKMTRRDLRRERGSQPVVSSPTRLPRPPLVGTPPKRSSLRRGLRGALPLTIGHVPASRSQFDGPFLLTFCCSFVSF